MVEEGLQNASLPAMCSFIVLMFKLAITSNWLGRDYSSVVAVSERQEHVGARTLSIHASNRDNASTNLFRLIRLKDIVLSKQVNSRTQDPTLTEDHALITVYQKIP